MSSADNSNIVGILGRMFIEPLSLAAAFQRGYPTARLIDTTAALRTSPASRLIGTPRKRTISARGVCHGASSERRWRRPGDAERPQESGVAALGRRGRMSRQRKSAAVLRLLRGEDLERLPIRHASPRR